jgi:hypothetical protein
MFYNFGVKFVVYDKSKKNDLMLKKIIYATIVLLVSQTNFSQNKGIEKSLFNIQTGLLGTWVNNETKLTSNLALRSEIGLDAGIFGGEINGNTGVFLTPVINFEPRWYYNINKREKKGKKTTNNNANFLTTSISYHPDWFVISKRDNLSVTNQLSIIPKWGIRRNIAKSNFNFEAGIGLGYRFYFLKQYGFSKNDGETALDLHLRVGYTFKKLKK